MANADHRTARTILLSIGFALVLAACGASTDRASTTATNAPDAVEAEEEADAAEDAAAAAEPIVIANQGGDLEGHTPRGFAGMGTGLFAGDELNSGFPQDDGVQIWLTFELPDSVDRVSEATVRSEALTVRGNPFEALGNLEIAPVRFDAFGPGVVGTEPVGATVTCPPPDGSSFTCDVTDALTDEITAGRERAQFRLRFEGISDPDGEGDLALFFLTDSNTNEPGIFNLELR